MNVQACFPEKLEGPSEYRRAFSFTSLAYLVAPNKLNKGPPSRPPPAGGRSPYSRTKHRLRRGRELAGKSGAVPRADRFDARHHTGEQCPGHLADLIGGNRGDGFQ